MSIIPRIDRTWVRKQLDDARDRGHHFPPKVLHAIIEYQWFISEGHEDGMRNLEDCFIPLVTEDVIDSGEAPKSKEDSNHKNDTRNDADVYK